MLRYAMLRILWLLPVLLGISVLVFALLKLVPGDPALSILGAYATPERVAALRRSMGLERALPVQYLAWLGGVLRGDLGHSYALEQPVLEVVRAHLGPTLLLALAALTLGTTLGLGAGALAACHRGRPLDRICTALALLGISTPSFWLAMLLMLALGVWLPLFPVSGMRDPARAAPATLDLLHHLVLPAIPLALVIAGVLARLMRAAMIDALTADHLEAARALGVPEARVRYRLAFKQAAAALVPVIGLEAGYALGGAVYIESVFQWPGLGRLLVNAIAKRDLMLVQGSVLVLASSYVLLSLLSDLVQRLLDPRVSA